MMDEKFDQYSQVDPEKQIKVEQTIEEKDLNRHYNFFKSLKRSSTYTNTAGLFIAALIVVGAIIAGVSLQNNNTAPEDTQAGSECSNFQVKVITANGYYCDDCGAGEYGKLDLCLEDNEGRRCELVTSTRCYKPVIE